MSEPPGDVEERAPAVPFGDRLPARVRWVFDGDGLPAREDLPRYVAPLPPWLENLALNLAWVVVGVNLLGTAFGFWYYGIHPFSDPLVQLQLSTEPLVMWPFVPDSPVATLFIALSLASWKLGHGREWLHALAFFGCIKLGAWTPFVLLAFVEQFSYNHWTMYNFLFWSHLAMVAQAFVVHRYAAFTVRGVAVALAWYALNDVVDYFVPVVGTPHHTWIPAERVVGDAVYHYPPEVPPVVYEVGGLVLEAQPHGVAAGGAVVLTLVATFLALATRVEKLQ